MNQRTHAKRVLDRPVRYRAPLLWVGLALAATLYSTGCGRRTPRHLESNYGGLRGAGADRAVDGIDVLAEMFRRNGHRVQRWRRLSPRLMGKERRADEPDPSKAYDVIVWAPQSFDSVGTEHYDFLGQFVDEGGTLILVGRSFDPVTEYWRQTLARYEGEDLPRIIREAMSDQSRFQKKMIEDLPAVTPWCRFVWQTGDAQVKSLSGEWAVGIDVDKTRIIVPARMLPFQLETGSTGLDLLKRLLPSFDLEDDAEEDTDEKNSETPGKTPAGLKELQRKLLDWPNDAPLVLRQPQVETVLGSDRGPLVLRITGAESTVEDEDGFIWGEDSTGQVLLCANGSFLLNLGMLPEGNRDLAQLLVDECPPAGKVAVISSGSNRVPVRDSEASLRHIPPRHEPLGTILDHVTFLAVVVCFVFFPIFGRPKEHPAPPLSDFGEHINAVAEIMEKTNDAEYARRQVAAYRQLTRRDDRAQPP